MSQMVSVRTEDLAGPALVWAIEAIEGAALPVAANFSWPSALYRWTTLSAIA